VNQLDLFSKQDCKYLCDTVLNSTRFRCICFISGILAVLWHWRWYHLFYFD